MKNFKVGSIFAIPGGDQFGLAKVIYISDYFKDVFLIKLFQHKFDSIEAINLNDKLEQFTLYYAAKDALKKGEWQFLGEEAVSETEKALSKRIVGGGIWVEDNFLGDATDKDYETLSPMDVYGWKLIQKAVGKLS
jgi:Immunity protein 26